MHKCAAPLLDEQHKQRHQEAITRLFDLLDGRGDRVTAWLEEKRDRLSAAMLYERAAEIQLRLDALRELLRRQVILEAAIQCRCVLVRQEADGHEDARLLLVAHGRVISTRPAGEAQPNEIIRWVRAHQPVVQALSGKEAELDAASVLERWLVTNRERVRWVAVPHDASEEDLQDRVAYVLTGRPD
jgi:excinuclease UvrABC nuclease subunit